MRLQEVLIIETRHRPGTLASVLGRVASRKINLEHLHSLYRDRGWTRWELTVEVDRVTLQGLLDELEGLADVRVVGRSDRVLQRHLGGKIRVSPAIPASSQQILRDIYTPGVARVCNLIQQNPQASLDYTIRGNSVAIVSDGTAVLGLGNIGPLAAMPVIEGKAALMAELVNIVAIPIAINTRDPASAIATIEAISPTFGAILLEDFAAPQCFEIERELRARLPIPVMHDDQHGTAVVVLATLLRTAKLVNRNLTEMKIGQIGLGAAGLGIARLLRAYGCRHLYGADLREAALRQLEDIGGTASNKDGIMQTCDAVVLTTGVPGLIDPSLIRPGQVILSLSNPDPEIDPILAMDRGAAFAADGKSINNLLGFPGLFRGALDARARAFTDPMLFAAANAIADLSPDAEAVPNGLDREVHAKVAAAVRAAAEAGAK